MEKDNDNIYLTMEELTGMSTEAYLQLRELQRRFQPFTIEAVKDGNEAVYTRDGRPVRILCTDRKGTGDNILAETEMPVVALVPHRLIAGFEQIRTYTADGHCSLNYHFNMDDENDLFVVPINHE